MISRKLYNIRIQQLFIFLIVFNSIVSWSQSDFETKVDTILKSYNAITKPGLSIGIVKNGELIYNKGFGSANLDYGIKNSDSTLFDIASVAKQFTAACVWTLIKKGKLSLEDNIKTYLHELPEYTNAIKIKHMLNHTSGLRDYSSILDLAGSDYTKQLFTNKDVYELACQQKNLNNIPGEKVIYGNTPFNLLTIIVERISGLSFDEYAKQNIFIPLGMKNTQYRVNNSDIIKNRAIGYFKIKDSYKQFNRIESCYGAGSLWSNINDLTIWSTIFTQKNSDYAELANFLTTKDALNNGLKASYSRGVMVDDYKGKKTVHHSGITNGYRSQIISIPDISLSVILLANHNNINPDAISYKIIDLFIEEQQNYKAEKDYSHSKKQLKKFTGTYQEKNSCLKMNIIYKKDTLFAKSSLGKNLIPLSSKTKNTLHRLHSENVKYVFNDSPENELIVYFGATPFYFERITLADVLKINLNDYTGQFFSEELNVNYHFYTENDKLYLDYPNNKKIELHPGQKDEFGNGYRTKYTFIRNKDNKVHKILVASEGTIHSIEFKKVR